MTSDAVPRRGPRPGHALVFFLLALVGQNLDLYTKHLAFERFPLNSPPAVFLPRVLGFQTTMNSGIIWGIGRGSGAAFLWIALAAVPLIVVLFWTLKEVRWITTVSLGLILAGTLGNLYDRLTLGAVRDFIQLEAVQTLLGRPFPLFNLADSFICSGVVLLAVEILFFDARKKPAPAPASAAPPAGSAPDAPGR